MKFVEVADLHFDKPLTMISDKSDFGEIRRHEQREAFKFMIDFIIKNKVEYLFICGDLYEQEYVRASTIEFINDQFKKIDNTKVYIVPGNHDPLLVNSYYNKFEWNDNVKIFNQHLEMDQTSDCDIYGYGFEDYELPYTDQLEKMKIKDRNKINIFLTHGEIINGNKSSSIYNPISKSVLEEKNFDFVGIGHIHIRDEYYPGAFTASGFKDLGEHGFIYGEITRDEKSIYSFNGYQNKYQVEKKFIKADNREFIVHDVDISYVKSKEELVDLLNSINTENNFFEINLVGTKDIPIDINMNLIQKNILKIKDSTTIDFEIAENDNTISGIFMRKLNEKLKSEEITDDDYKYIMDLSYRVFKG